MAKATNTRKAPAKRDPLDHDGDGKKGGSMPKAKSGAAVVAEAPATAAGTLPDPVVISSLMSGPTSGANGRELIQESVDRAVGILMAANFPGKPVTEVELPELTPRLEPAGALLNVYKHGNGHCRLEYENGCVKESGGL